MERNFVGKAGEIARLRFERFVMGTAFLPVEVPWNERVGSVIVIAGIIGIGLVNKFIINPMIERSRENSERREVK